jgi:hypothetical protein
MGNGIVGISEFVQLITAAYHLVRLVPLQKQQTGKEGKKGKSGRARG